MAEQLLAEALDDIVCTFSDGCHGRKRSTGCNVDIDTSRPSCELQGIFSELFVPPVVVEHLLKKRP